MKKYICLLLVIVVALFSFAAFSDGQLSSYIESAIAENSRKEASTENYWNLILVNSQYYVPDDYEPELLTLSNGERIDERIYPALQDMFDTMRAEGVYPVVASGYRSTETQKELLENKILAYRDEGYSKSEAKDLALDWVAVPSTSEHQLGIAVDINAEKNKSSSDEVYSWLRKNSYKFGFIYRYPPDKIEITGIANEPWHYRYVGKEAAEEIYFSGVCLEEYIENL